MATALVAWIVIPLRPAEPETYATIAVENHRACTLARAVKPRDGRSYAADDLMALIPNGGGSIRVIEGHDCGQAMDFMHVVVQDTGGGKASIFVTRVGEGGERIMPPERHGDFEVSQVRTTRHRAVVVIDRQHAHRFRQWREMTMPRMQQFLRQREGL